MLFKRKKKTDSRKYNKDMAVQYGEQYGALIADLFSTPVGTADYDRLFAESQEAYDKMIGYAHKALGCVPTPDYES